MTRVDFYILPQADESARLQYVCRLADKAWQLGNRILIHTVSNDAAQQMDRALWTFRPDSFVPHDVLPAMQLSPVHIGSGEDSGGHHDLLINLGATIPGFFSRFERVAEVVTQEPAQLAQSRERYRFYRERGYALEIHNIGKRA
ncbi:MAG TPA: DNA polymerase III subunit chi [Pseudomonadales bacterium]|nr:DNA polymerase III subunit chi [Pseudomonadales bacterium]